MAELRASAAYRIAFTYSAAFAMAILVLGASVYFLAHVEFQRQQDASVFEEASELIHDYQREGALELRDSIAIREKGGASNPFVYAVFDATGRRIEGALDLPRPAPGWSDITFNDPVEGPDSARALATDIGGGKILLVALDTETLERIDSTILALFGGAFVLVVLLGIGGALVLGGYLRNRLDRISGTAQAIIAGDLTRRVPVGARGDEFDRVGLALNAMLDRIAQLLENLRQVSGDVAHDLRTPLARLRAELEQALDRSEDIEGHRTRLKRAIAQSDEILSLFGAILRISEVEGGEIAQTFIPVDLTALANDLCETCAPALADGGRTLQCVAEQGIIVRGNRELIAQAIINLIDNAQIHTPPGTAIRIEVAADADTANVVVADRGPGVPAADRERIVRRFVRLESSRGTRGNGLGLNLVSAIAVAHGGTLTIGDNYPGLRVTIVLPRLPA